MLVADIPGASEENTDISLEKNVLTIRGRVERPEMEGFQLSWSEQSGGEFERAFTISRDIDRAAIQATIRDGVLRVTLPKKADAGLQKIAVTTA